jgi:hypothetical protein
MGDVLGGGLLLARLPKGSVGEDTARLVGALLVAAVWQAATARADSQVRPDATLYVDECQNFLALPTGIDDVLAEARGYHLSIVLAHQHLGQLPRDIAEAASANARNKIYFCCSPEDARVLGRHTEPYLKAYDLCHLDAHQVACRLVVAGKDLHAFTLRTRPLPAAVAGRADQARKYARENAGRSRAKRRQDELARRRRHRRTAGGGPGDASPGVSPGGPAGVPDTPAGAPKNRQHRPPPPSASQDPDSWDHL